MVNRIGSRVLSRMRYSEAADVKAATVNAAEAATMLVQGGNNVIAVTAAR